MSKLVTQHNEIIFNDENASLFTHSVFCQCALPIRSLAANVDYYETSHGNTSLAIQSGYLKDETTNKAVKQEIPAGAKARLLFAYINNQAIRYSSSNVDMGSSLRDFMERNRVPIGGQNAKEITRQVRNIASAHIYLGVWGETDKYKYNHQESIKIAKSMSFWLEKEHSQATLWQPTMTLSDDYMAALEHHRVPINFEALVGLQANPRAMDMYVWLTYRVRAIRRPVSIPYDALHEVFGQGIKESRNFRTHFKKAITLALKYLPHVEVEFTRNNIVIRNLTQSFMANVADVQIGQGAPAVIEGNVATSTKYHTDNFYKVSQLLEGCNFSDVKIKHFCANYDVDAITKAVEVLNAGRNAGKIDNVQAYFTKALKEKWEPAVSSKEEVAPIPEIDGEYEKGIADTSWKRVRGLFIEKFGVACFNNWIKDVALVERQEGNIMLQAQTPFKSIWIEKNYLSDLFKFWTQVEAPISAVKITARSANTPGYAKSI